MDLVSDMAYHEGYQGFPIHKDCLFYFNWNLILCVKLAIFLNGNIDHCMGPDMLSLITKI